MRIGELSRRLGVTDHVLRAWENRYGLLQPVRSKGGYRLYSAADESRIRRMIAHLADGLPAAEAARTVLREDSAAGGDIALSPEHTAREDFVALRQALDALDEPAAQAIWIGCCLTSRSRPSCGTSSSPISPSSANVGSMGRSASPRNTSPAMSSVAG